ncbi:PLP-dependent transferase [Annulohypoxylon maeteangense]|uniref:PLP-dependent transferase n=1 Tax=Annulohypoxylon maeteangense TaxID=1927788 RepID=UPI002007ABAF|nr:PLP-dependent transferase [Annulohypoxylon maeteangense]KAI0890472.1 PLP-dependent transferase [Annulohypoxylon maeteangense]
MTGDGGNMAYNSRIEGFRQNEFPMLRDEVYLDHAGTTLYAKSLVDKFAADMTSNLFGNPHSASFSSQTSTSRIEDVRLRVLQFFNADPSEFDLVFVSNATAGIKLVTEAFRGHALGFDYLYHQACHTSLIGVREEATHNHCLDNAGVDSWLGGTNPFTDLSHHDSPLLVAYPAQSNMDGSRFPLEWADQFRRSQAASHRPTFTLLDAAAFVATSPLDLSNSETAPDFTVLSFYKMFGFPDLGGLIVRRQAAPIFRSRKYFGGGTVDMVVCLREQWHAPKSQALHESLEDGTLPIHSIIALDSALDVHRRLFISMKDVSSHTSFLSQRLYDGLATLKHSNGQPVCLIYSQPSLTSKQVGTPLGNGPVVSFNLQNHLGGWISLVEFEKLAVLKKFHVRTGGLCNPGGIANALNLAPWEMKRNFSAGFRCGTDNDIMSGKPTGVIRVSLGGMSTISDVDRFIAFIIEFYLTENIPEFISPALVPDPPSLPNMSVKGITVFPIKSCGGFHIPTGVAWEVRAEGLAWDREWCLVHRGTGQALSQKRHPRMALIRPVIDFSKGQLRVSYFGPLLQKILPEVAVPLSANPSLFQASMTSNPMASRVCGEEISAQIYTSREVNDFFTAALGVPCALARFPPGGLGNSMRHAKAHLQKHQKVNRRSQCMIPCQFPGMDTPPDSDSESERQRILLSNESPILAINLSSLEALNRLLTEQGGKAVSPEVFRANIVVGPLTAGSQRFAYSEDHWSSLRIGQQDFKMLGSCRRCHMICIDQETAEKNEEPFVTLSKTRRFDGKVFFGTHMCHLPSPNTSTKETQFPTISVGDKVLVDPV